MGTELAGIDLAALQNARPGIEAALLRSVCTQSFYRFVQEFWPIVVAEKPHWNWHIEYLCQKLQTMLEDVIAGRPKKYDLIINLPPGSSKCGRADTEVLCEDGYIPAKDVQVGDMVYSYDFSTNTLCKRPIVAKEQSKAECVTILTHLGEEGTYTRNHPFWTQRGWVNAEDLTTDDYVQVLCTPLDFNSPVVESELDDIAQDVIAGTIDRLPRYIYTVPLDQKELFIRTILEKKGWWVELNSKALATDLKRLLATMGIMATVNSADGENARLSIHWETCSLDLPYKTEHTKRRRCYYPLTTVQACLENGGLYIQGGTAYYHPKDAQDMKLCSSAGSVSRAILEKLLPHEPKLKTLLDSPCRWSKVTGIFNAGECEIFHLQVGAEHYNDQNLFTDNYLTHNSTLFSILFPAYAWARMPSCRFITASFQDKLAEGFARKSKQLIKSDLYRQMFGEFKFIPDRQGHYVNQYKGERIVYTTGQSPTGQHAHFILIDDPVDPLAQDRETNTYNVNLWMHRVIRSRTVDAQVTPLILVMQRLSLDDPTGDWLEKAEDGGKVFHVCLPASIESGQHVKPPGLKRYYRNNLFDPVRLPYSVLEDRKLWMVAADYAAQYDQSPLPKEGLMFKIQYLTVKPIEALDPIVAKCRYWDKAISTSLNACFTVGALMGRTRTGKFVLMDIQRGQWDAATREAIILNTAKADGPETVVGIEQEPGSGGMESAMYTVRNLAGFPVYVDRASQSKEARAEPLAIQVEHGNVSLLEGAWNATFLSEIGSFPRGRYKDQVDATVGAFRVLCGADSRTAGAL